MSTLDLLALVTAMIAVPPSLYLFVCAVFGGARVAPPHRVGNVTFAVVVPAHNEQGSIASTIQMLQKLDYPASLHEIIVVADHCEDSTAAIARSQGVRVIERRDGERQGKGHALEHAFDVLLDEPRFDAFVIVDADTEVDGNLLTAFARRLEAGERACQAEYAVANIDESWRTRMMALAFALFHATRSNARERFGLSCGLRGNGMCFSRALIEEHPHRAVSLAEDVEYGLVIGLAGVRVAYVWDAQVRGDMPASGIMAAPQRRRWERGRLKLLRDYWCRLLIESLRGNFLCLDLLVDLLIPPLTYIALLVVAGLGLEAVRFGSGGAAASSTAMSVVSLIGLLVYIARGAHLSGLGLGVVSILLRAPLYCLWKLSIARPFRAQPDWIRSPRLGE